MTDGGVGEDAVGAGLDPLLNVGAKFVPEETEADAVECFVVFEVASSR